MIWNGLSFEIVSFLLTEWKTMVRSYDEAQLINKRTNYDTWHGVIKKSFLWWKNIQRRYDFHLWLENKQIVKVMVKVLRVAEIGKRVKIANISKKTRKEKHENRTRRDLRTRVRTGEQ